MITSRITRPRTHALVLLLLLILALSLTAAPAGHARDRLQTSPPAFSKAFAPATVGPGSSSTLTFTIDNATDSPVGELAFTDTLPAGLTIATPASGQTNCEGVLDAPDGGSTITFSGGVVAAGSTCTITVNVTSSTIPGTYTNVSGDLTSDAGNSGSATADLIVDANRPGFSKSFGPATTIVEENSTLTFTLDNSANGSNVSGSFSDALPEGVVVASPTNAVSDCASFSTNAASGSTVFSVSLFVTAGTACTFTIDVTATTVGEKNNVSGEFTIFGSSAGFATALLTVEPPPPFHKRFVDSPAPPGGTATLEFSITNMDRSSSATGITFTDDLDAALSGLAATGLPAADVCGTGSLLEGASTITMTNGILGPAETCSFTVTVQVPTTAAAGIYTNTTSDLTSDAGPMEPAATNDLEVAPFPTLLTSFVPDHVGSGNLVDMEFTLVNNSPTSSATDISFHQILGDVLPGSTVVNLPAGGFCGPSSTIGQTTGAPYNTLTLVIAGGSLAPAEQPGDTCTFTVSLELSTSTPSGAYTLTSSAPQATVDAETYFGRPASADLSVVAPPRLTKSFTDDPVVAGETVTLEFTLTQPEEGAFPATNVAFTDDLSAALTGLEAVDLPADDVCGTGSQLDGTSTLTFSGGELAAGASCTFATTLQVPAGADPGAYTNTTGNVTATVDGIATEGPPASDDLDIRSLSLVKSFSRDTVVQGDMVTLAFTLTNESPTASATDITFTDDLNAALPGLEAVDLPQADVCGAGSELSGTSLLTLTGGALPPASSCTFVTTLQVPAGATSGEYHNVTSQVTANLDGSPLTVDAAADGLIVLDVLSFAKSFAADGAAPGETITLTFSITNESATSTIADVTFADDLDAALSGLTAVGLPVSDVCGAGSTLSGASVIELTGGILDPGETCTFDAALQMPASVSAGSTAINTTSPITGSLGGATVTGPTATDELDIFYFAFSKSFDGPTGVGGNPTLTFTIENLTQEEQSELSFIDDLDAALPGLAAIDLPLGDVCGPGSQLDGTSTLAFTGGSLAAGLSCTFSATLQVPAATTPGSYLNTTSDLTSSGLVVGPPATDTLEVGPAPTFAKQFAPDLIPLGTTSTLTFTIDNGASAFAATDLDFADNLPAGLSIASPANAAATCTGGTLTAPAGGATISYSSGTVAAGATCTIAVDVAGDAAGTHTNTSGALTSSLGDSGTATDTLTVNPPPAFSKTFAPDPIPLGTTSTLTFTIDNGASTVAATGLAFTDNLPAGLSIASPANTSTTCTGGTLTAPASGTAISYSGGSVAAGGTCLVAVDVTGDEGGTYTNLSSALTSSLGTSSAATDTLVIVSPTIGVAVTAQPGSVPEPGGAVLFTVVVTNGTPVASLTLTTLEDDVHGDLNGQGSCDLPVGIGIGESYTCSFSAEVSGNAGDAITNTVTATAVDANDNQATGEDSATVTISDVLPAIASRLTATPTVILTPADPVTFTLRVTNTSLAETVTLVSLTDDAAGDLDGLGDCDVPVTLAAGDAYQCRYVLQVAGDAGERVTITVTAVAEDDEDNAASAQASVAVDVSFVRYFPFVGIDRTDGN